MGRKRLQGQRALVTGASSGIGLELARVLAEEGAHLVLVARRTERLEALAAELKQKHGVDARVLTSDLQQPDAARALFDQTEGQGLAIDVLVNNAGFGNYDDFVAIPWEKHATMLQVNVIALTQLSHLFLPKMLERRHGRLMNVASIGAYLPCPTFGVYAASKAYVRNVTEAIDYELKGTGVRAISVCPGGTTTEFLDAANQQLKPGASLAMMSAERCARIAVKKMLRGRRNVVTGVLNSLGMWLLRFVPRGLYAWLGAASMGAAVEKKPRALAATPPPPALPGPPAGV
ncbi:MAG: SDR family oxidoreductase [Planctomycetota bacterium]|nr:SDR family oxidoreductase [Planctomycetota bacterium]